MEKATIFLRMCRRIRQKISFEKLLPRSGSREREGQAKSVHGSPDLVKNLRQHRTIASASLRRLFAPLLQFEKPEIHTGFETVEKGLCPFLTKGLQSAARTICTPLAYKSHTCSLSCIFCQVHAPTENDQNPFAACGRQTLRGFFDTLKYIQDSFVFQTLNWGKNPV